MRFVLASASWIVLAASAAVASPLNATSQLRRVAAEANASDGQGEHGHPSETVTAPDFLPFDETATAYILVSNGVASATSHQQSTISDWALSAVGSFAADAVGTFGDPGYWEAAADNHFRVYFTLTESVDYSLFGLAQKQGRADVLVELKEGGVGGATLQQFWLSEFGSQTELPYSVAGSLDPGSYILFAWTNGAAWYDDYNEQLASCSGSYDMTFVLNGATSAPPPAPAARVAVWPNPFRESARFRLPDGVRSAVVFDATGRRIVELTDQLVWDGRDASGRAVAGGVYWVRAEGAPGVTKVVRLR